MPHLRSRLAAVFKNRGSRSPSPNPPPVLPPPSSVEDPTSRDYPPWWWAGCGGPPVPALPLQVIEDTSPETVQDWTGAGCRVEALPLSYFLNLLWAHENNIPAPRIIAKLPESKRHARLSITAEFERHGTTELYLVWHPEQIPSYGLVPADKLPPHIIPRVVQNLTKILEVFHSRKDERKDGLRGMVGTEGGDDIMRLLRRDVRTDVQLMKTMPQEEYWVTWMAAEREVDEEDHSRMVLTTLVNNTVPIVTEEHLRRLCQKDWNLRFTHGCLVPSHIWCKQDGTIVSLSEWANAGWWPEWYEAARAMRSRRFDRDGLPWVATLEREGIFADTREFWECARHLENFLDSAIGSSVDPEWLKNAPLRSQASRLLKRL